MITAKCRSYCTIRSSLDFVGDTEVEIRSCEQNWHEEYRDFLMQHPGDIVSNALSQANIRYHITYGV
jgi:hypothetical protein